MSYKHTLQLHAGLTALANLFGGDKWAAEVTAALKREPFEPQPDSQTASPEPLGRNYLREWALTYPRMDIMETKAGDLVMFDGRGGHESEVARAKQVLKVRGVYEVEDLRVYSSSSTVKLKGIGDLFNTVMFAEPPIMPAAEGATFTGQLTGLGPMIAFKHADGTTHIVSVEFAAKVLRELYEKFPGGIDEVEAALRSKEVFIGTPVVTSSTNQQADAWVRVHEYLVGLNNGKAIQLGDETGIEGALRFIGELHSKGIALGGSDAAIRTLAHLGYTWEGGVQWKPPLGSRPPSATVSRATLARLSRVLGHPKMVSAAASQNIDEALIELAIDQLNQQRPEQPRAPSIKDAEWIEWNGRPAEGELVRRLPKFGDDTPDTVSIRRRDGSTADIANYNLLVWLWGSTDQPTDIVAYKRNLYPF